MSRRNHNGYENDEFVNDNYGQNYGNSDEDYDPEEDVDGGIASYGPYSQGKARSGPGDRKLDGGRDRRKNPSSGYNNYDDYDDDDDDEDYDDYDDYDGNQRGQGGYGPYSTGKARSGQGDRKLDGGHDGRKKPGGNNPQGINGYTAGGRNQGRSNNYNNNNNNNNRRRNNYNDYDNDNDYGYNRNNQGQGGYGPYSTGKARSGQGDRKLDGGHDGRKKPGGNNPQGVNGYTAGGRNQGGNQGRSNNYNNNNRRGNYNNYDDDDDYDYNQGQGGYGPYSTGKARSGQGDRKLDGGHDGRKRPGGNNPQGINGYTSGNNRNRNRNHQNDYDDDNDSDDYGQNTRKQSNYGYNNRGGQNRSGPGDRKLDGSKDLRKKPNRSGNYNYNY